MEKSEIQDLYEKYGAALYRRAVSIVKNDQSASEILQDVFVAVIKNADSFRGEASPYTWLYRITTNLCLNYLKKNKREVLDMDVGAGQALPAVGAQQVAPLQDIQKFVKRLDDLSQKIFVHRYFDEMNQEEIAALLGISRKTVYLRLEKIEERLRKFFK